MPAGWLVGYPVVDYVKVLREGLREAPLCVADKLLLALGAGDQVYQVLSRAVHVAVYTNRLT